MVKVVTFGCRMNAYESEVIKEKLKEYTDLIVVNTCAVTGEAERQCRQTIRKLKRENPHCDIIVTGCSAQINSDNIAKMPEVSLVLGNHEKQNIENYIDAIYPDKKIVSNIFENVDNNDFPITGFEGRHKAFIQIQQGCNHRCTYCIIPYARGKSRSINPQHIITQIKNLLSSGYKEFCLTGIDICSYEPSLASLVKTIFNEIPTLPNLSFGSLDPAVIDNEFIDLVSKNNKISSYFHLSIQSGDNDVLRKMGRRHSREKIISICSNIREKRPDARFGADFICGFPTETLEAFENTCRLVKEARLNKLHVFPYSERSGTPAATWVQTPVNERRRRAEILRNLSEE